MCDEEGIILQVELTDCLDFDICKLMESSDVREAVLEQFESMRCKTIRVKAEEDE